MSGRGGRYQRSMAGMVGAMGVTLLLILGFVAFRAVNRESPHYEPEPVDYLPVVEALQSTGHLRPAYPPSLDDGWVSTLASWDLQRLTWRMNLLTDEGRFLGVRQSPRRSADDLVEEYVDDDAERGATLELDGGLPGEWTEWTDGRDYALVRETRRDVLLVVGTGDPAEIREFAASLVVAPVEH